jgi:hypothetical protein
METEKLLGKVELEFLRNINGVKAYINVFCGIISSSSTDSTTLVIKIGEVEYEDAIADIFEGQQRALLSDECTVRIINAFLRGETVVISFNGDEAVFQPANFHPLWEKLLNLPLTIK